MGRRLATFAPVMPLLHGATGVVIGRVLGMSRGGAVVLGTPTLPVT